MPYDLYGNYYKSEREAMNAELAQMSEIDNAHNQKRIHALEQTRVINSRNLAIHPDVRVSH